MITWFELLLERWHGEYIWACSAWFYSHALTFHHGHMSFHASCCRWAYTYIVMRVWLWWWWNQWHTFTWALCIIIGSASTTSEQTRSPTTDSLSISDARVHTIYVHIELPLREHWTVYLCWWCGLAFWLYTWRSVHPRGIHTHGQRGFHIGRRYTWDYHLGMAPNRGSDVEYGRASASSTIACTHEEDETLWDIR